MQIHVLGPVEVAVDGQACSLPGGGERDVAAQLFLSPRTVDFHLRGCFAELGITSRGELAVLSLNA